MSEKITARYVMDFLRAANAVVVLDKGWDKPWNELKEQVYNGKVPLAKEEQEEKLKKIETAVILYNAIREVNE